MNKAIAALLQTHGLDVSCFDETFLTKSLEKRRNVAAGETPAGYLKRLVEDGAEAEAFQRSLRVTYSEFFRNPLSFALLEQLIFPALVQEREESDRAEIRIWSAGCAAGQEALSVAILVEELTSAWERPVPFRIIATDVSEADVAAARRGVYSEASVGNVPLRRLAVYFSRLGDTYTIAPRIRAHVDFSLYDLLDESTTCPPTSVYGDFDLALCCNVLIYYRPETQRVILDKLRLSLAPGGYLVTGETERQIVESAGGFRAVCPPRTGFS